MAVGGVLRCANTRTHMGRTATSLTCPPSVRETHVAGHGYGGRGLHWTFHNTKSANGRIEGDQLTLDFEAVNDARSIDRDVKR